MKPRWYGISLLCCVLAIVAAPTCPPAQAGSTVDLEIKVEITTYPSWGWGGNQTISFTMKGDYEDSGTGSWEGWVTDGVIYYRLTLWGQKGTIRVVVEEEPVENAYWVYRRLGTFHVESGTGDYAGLEASGESIMDQVPSWSIGWYSPPAKTYFTLQTSSSPNVAPDAQVAFHPAEGAAPLTTVVYSVSTDADGVVVKYEWDLDDDGVFELDTGTTSSRSLTYDEAGTYTVSVRVTDNDGATDTASASIVVTAPAPPPGPTTLADDGFESQSWSGGSGAWLGSWAASGDVALRVNRDGPHAGSVHTRLRRGNGWLERKVNLLGVTQAKLSFWAKIRSLERSDQAHVWVSHDGVSFTKVKTFTRADSDNTYHHYEIDLSGHLRTSSFVVAFDSAMNSRRDHLYIDDVRVIGVPGY